MAKSPDRSVFLWALYDFANTPITTAMGGLFLAQWVVLDNGLPDIVYGGVFTLSTILLLLTSPFLGTWSDKVGKRIPFIKWATFGLVVSGILMAFVATSHIPKTPRVMIALGLYFLMQYFYQVSLIFYNALLDKLSSPSTRGKISGIGEAFGEVGWLLAPIILLPFALGNITVWGEPGRAQVFFPATFLLVLLGLPLILWFKENTAKLPGDNSPAPSVFKETLLGLKSLFRENRNVATFLVSFMLVSDALLTAGLYFAIYMDRIFQISDFQKFISFTLVNITAVFSAILVAKIGDKWGLKRLLVFSCINLTASYLFITFISSVVFLYVSCVFIGFGYGGFYTVARAMLVKISPIGRLGEYFGFYSMFQKFASIIGPMIYGAVSLLLVNYGEWQYRGSILSLSFLMLLGTLLLTKVKEEKAIV